MKNLRNTLFILLLTPSFLFAKDYNILDFGAIADGKTVSTAAIEAAVDKASKAGGGRVLIPEGNFVSGSIIMKTGVELHLEKNATILGSLNPDDYKRLNRWLAILMAEGVSDIAVTGKGTIDGRGRALALHIDSLFYAGKIDSFHYVFKEKRPRVTMRPQIIEFTDCQRVTVTGVTIQNCASWVQSYWQCVDLTIDSIRVESDTYWNNDGMDIIDCKRVRITNCYINSSDDGICLKSNVLNSAPDSIPRCDSIYIANCTIRSSASAIKFGTWSYSGFKNVTIEKIKVFDTFRSVVALESYLGGTLENVLIQDIKAENTGNAIFIRAGKRKDQENGVIRNVIIRNVQVEIADDIPDKHYDIRGPALPFFHNGFPSVISGIPGNPVQNVQLENIEITYPGGGLQAYASMPLDRIESIPELPGAYPEFSMFGELPAWGFYVRHAEGLSMKNVSLKIKKPDYRPAFVLDDVKKANLKVIQISGDDKPRPVYLNRSEDVVVDIVEE
jgi:polygalacturonase